MNHAAAIDMGSNAIRLIIAESKSARSIKVVYAIREPIRLGEDAFRVGKLSAEIQDRVILAVNQFAKILKQFKVSRVRAVATSAMRESKNGKELIERIRKATGIEVEIIPGEEEARLVHLAVASKVRLDRKLALLIDIGGGSVEVTVVQNGNVIRAESLQLGTVRLLNTVGRQGNQAIAIQRLIRTYVKNLRKRIPASLLKKGFDLCVGTGGNLEALSDLRQTLLHRRSSNKLTFRELTSVVSRLEELSVAERAKQFGLRLDRADVIMPASYFIRAVLEEIGVREIVIPRTGLKDGVLLDLFATTTREKKRQHLFKQRPRLVAFADEFMQKFACDLLHCKHVAELAVQLFEKTRPLHRLGSEEKVLLEIAGLLHEVGRYIESEDYHKHSAYIISETSFVGLSAKQRKLVGAICRYHRGALPSVQHKELLGLNPQEKKQVIQLASLLRIANALDREHAKNIKTVSIQISRGKLTLRAKGKGAMSMERWAFEGAKKMCERAFRKRIEFI